VTPFFLLNPPLITTIGHAPSGHLFLVAVIAFPKDGIAGRSWPVSAAARRSGFSPVSRWHWRSPRDLARPEWVREGGGESWPPLRAPVIVALAGLAAQPENVRVDLAKLATVPMIGRHPARMGADHLVVTGWWILKLCFWLVPAVSGLWFLVRGRECGSGSGGADLVLMLASLACLVFVSGSEQRGQRVWPPYYSTAHHLAILLAPAGCGRRRPWRGWCRGESEARDSAGPRFRSLLTVAGRCPS